MFGYPVDPSSAVNALIAIATAVAGLIGWILNKRSKAKRAIATQEDIDNQPNMWISRLLEERETLQKDRATERRALLAELDKAKAQAAEAWRVRESLTSQVATLDANNRALEKEILELRTTVDRLIKAVQRLDPKLLDAFGSDFVPLR